MFVNKTNIDKLKRNWKINIQNLHFGICNWNKWDGNTCSDWYWTYYFVRKPIYSTTILCLLHKYFSNVRVVFSYYVRHVNFTRKLLNVSICFGAIQRGKMMLVYNLHTRWTYIWYIFPMTGCIFVVELIDQFSSKMGKLIFEFFGIINTKT